jgi:hypothetical protein
MVDILKENIVKLEEQKQAVHQARWEVEQEFIKEMNEHFGRFFKGTVSEDITVDCTSSSIQFKKKNEEGTYDKEIFNLYLKENYFREGEPPYKGIELSYYTTSTNSDWEVQRLVNLGRVAEAFSKFKEQIVSDANKLRTVYLERIDKGNYWNDSYDIDKQISNIRNIIREQETNSIKERLFKDGVEFDKGVYIRFKFNFEPFLRSIKLVDINRSGKKATAVFTYVHGEHISREENVDVAKVTDQVLGYSKNIVQPETVE